MAVLVGSISFCSAYNRRVKEEPSKRNAAREVERNAETPQPWSYFIVFNPGALLSCLRLEICMATVNNYSSLITWKIRKAWRTLLIPASPHFRKQARPPYFMLLPIANVLCVPQIPCVGNNPQCYRVGSLKRCLGPVIATRESLL